ncbi:enoyl-CoA hydratase/isomerase family protein [uncultured Dysosmobacter sp.]|uniref:enoyl-CoA hydratase/isomerase family protein n=1 Tax=uncultured Dysosmobacter sp. TaxID=2591384 RepID=UPI002617B366|nr:enoyl-CoA hydratase-related protein [uncultured Dysosmobacter sp.]
MADLVQLEKRDGWAIMTLNDAATLNSLRMPLIKDISATLDEVNADPSLRAVVITGVGKTFIAGGDLAYMKDIGSEESMKYVEANMEACGKISSSSKIFIAAINGFALGGGCEVALACDIRIASEKAKIGFPEVTLGILPGAGGTQRLPRIIGMGRAAEMILTGEVVNAQGALELGIVSHVVPGEELMAKAEELVERVKKTSPIGVAGAKSCLYQSACMGLDSGLMYERRMWGLCFATEDKHEGMQAFFDKRPPVFQGK